MPSNIFTAKTQYVCKKSLIRFKNNLGFIKAVTLKPWHEVGTGVRKGKDFDDRLPFRVVTGDGPNIHKQPLIDKKVNSVINIDKNVAVELDVLDKATDIDQYVDEYIHPLIDQLAADVALIIAEEGKLAPNYVGTPAGGANVDTMRHASAVMTTLSVPAKRTAVVEPHVIEGIGDQIQTYQMDIAKKAVTSDYRGRVAGFNVIETANMGTQKVGDYGAAGSITYASHQIIGLTDTCIMTLGASLANDLFKGQNFTIQGVNSVNPVTRATTNRPAQFSLLKDAPAGSTTLTLSTDINSGTTVVNDPLGVAVSLAAYQNVDKAPVAGAPLNFFGAANMDYAYSLLFHKSAIRYYPVNLGHSDAFNHMTTEVNKETGLSMTMFMDGDINDRVETSRIDIVGAVKMVNPPLCFKMYS